ncbi:MAG: RsmB/NOP family class I SAM-dependent RNA methyltransferase [Ignavibacteriales bacterium]|nr:MAG: RsmB/NOP family class I SAM-dependent RNA methyltransferase [Ignavibacteriales bacterium]
MIEVSKNIYTYLVNLYGEEKSAHYLDYIKQEPAQYIRVNSLKTNPNDLSELLFNNYRIETKTIDNLPNSLLVQSGNELIGKTVEHITGLYYIQSLSSLLPPYVLKPSPGERVLDLCAAPGSKSTQLAELMRNTGTLIVNEIQLSRVKTLVYNLDRMNIINAGVLNFKGEILSKIYDNYFDKVLVDVPCSGLGIIQKKEEVSNWWSTKRVKALSELQLKLLIAAIKMTKPGGNIVYSTCTLTPEENELVINSVLKKYPVILDSFDLPVTNQQGLTKYDDELLSNDLSLTKRMIPWEVNSDGFFLARLIKKEETPPMEKLSSLRAKDVLITDYKNKKINSHLLRLFNYYGIDEALLERFRFQLKNNDIYFHNANWSDDNPGIYERIGTRFGLIDRNGEIILNTQAAQVLAEYFRENVYYITEGIELNRYLEGGIFKNKSTIKGQCVVSFNNNVLGSAVVTESGVKSRFPRAKRTQDIHKEF